MMPENWSRETRSEEPHDPPVVSHCWTARKLHPVILFYVALVFLACMALAYFVFDSMTAVKALALTAVCSIIPLTPGMTGRVEYRLTEVGLEHRPVGGKKQEPFEDVFHWDQLDHIVPLKHGFKYYKHLNEPKPLRRFWKTHVSDAFSGEVHVDPGDRERVLQMMADHAIPTARPGKTR